MEELPWKTLSRQSQYKTCAVAVCKTPHPPQTSLHKFPKDLDLRRKWTQACKRKHKFNVDSAIICSRHFSEDCFERDLRSELMQKKKAWLLKPGSIPTLNLLPKQSDVPEAEKSSRRERMQEKEKREVARELVKEALSSGGHKRDEEEEEEEFSTADAPFPEEGPSTVATAFPVAAAGGERKEDKMREKEVQVSPPMEDKQVQCNENGEITALKRRIKNLEMQLLREKRKKKATQMSAQERKKIARNILSEKTDLTTQQIEVLLTGKKKTRWQAEDIVLGLTLRALSRKAYEFLRRKNILPLPSLTTLRRYIKSFECRPGIQENIIQGRFFTLLYKSAP